jgi:hypothetical protein
LSTHEVWEDVDGNTSDGIDYYDTAYSDTRQLDYYSYSNVTTSKNKTIVNKKNLSNTISYWWLRSAFSSSSNPFFHVKNGGSWDNAYARNANGVSPAFRIAE